MRTVYYVTTLVALLVIGYILLHANQLI